MRTRKSRRRGQMTPPAQPTHPVAPADRPAYPRGNPHTDWVAVTDHQGTSWLAYVEPMAGEEPFRRSAAVLPGRRLRFDSLERSLVVSPIPAGAPFLADERLRRLLAAAEPLAAEPEPAAATAPVRPLRSIDWGASLAGAVAAARDAAAAQWRGTAELRRLWVRGLVHLVAPAALLLVVLWEAMLVRSRARI
jgi:hypothetical protein